jgi:multiple sugar transport system substrate-binding protein
VDGKIYQVKMVDDMGVLYYRKSILEKAGVQPPTTIDELIAAPRRSTQRTRRACSSAMTRA